MTGERRIVSRRTIGRGALAMALLGTLFFAGRAMAADATAPAAELKNPFAGKADAVNEGKALFLSKCSECHGDGEGGTGPDLMDERWIYWSTDADLFETISFGRKGGMPSWASDLSKEERWKLIAFIRSIQKK